MRFIRVGDAYVNADKVLSVRPNRTAGITVMVDGGYGYPDKEQTVEQFLEKLDTVRDSLLGVTPAPIQLDPDAGSVERPGRSVWARLFG
jgi:hypothetical protein